MSAAFTAARALTTGTMIAASAATVGIGVHLANAHSVAGSTPSTESVQTYRETHREDGEHRSRDDDGGQLGQLLQGSTATGGTSSGVTAGSGSQTRTRGS